MVTKKKVRKKNAGGKFTNPDFLNNIFLADELGEVYFIKRSESEVLDKEVDELSDFSNMTGYSFKLIGLNQEGEPDVDFNDWSKPQRDAAMERLHVPRWTGATGAKKVLRFVAEQLQQGVSTSCIPRGAFGLAATCYIINLASFNTALDQAHYRPNRHLPKS